ncbi:MAG: hypothetical protein DRI46_13955, partial [Chloroflexi bacterium]
MALKVTYKAPPKVVVGGTPPKPKLKVRPLPKRPPLKVKPYKAPKLGAVGSGSQKNYVNAPGYNPQGSSYNPQKAVTPQKTARVFFTNKYDPQSGTYTKVRNIKALTDEQWRVEQIKLKAQTVIKAKLDADIAKFGDTAAGKADIYNSMNNEYESLKVGVETRKISTDKQIADLTQKSNDADSYDEAIGYYNEAQKIIDQYNDWSELQSYVSSELYSQYKVQLDAPAGGVLGKATRGLEATTGFLHSKGLGNFNLGNLWKYSLGEGTAQTPSLLSLGHRGIKFAQNVVDPNRTFTYEGEKVKGVKGPEGNFPSIGDRWRTTFKQQVFNKPDFYDKEKGVIENASNNFSNWAKAFGIDKSPEEMVGLATFIAEEFADPANYIGAGAIRKFKSAIKTADKSSEFTRLFRKLDDLTTFSKTKGRVAQSTFGDVVKYPWKKSLSTDEKLAEASTELSKARRSAQATTLKQVKDINEEIVKQGGKKLDVKVLDDMKKLTDAESKWLQRTIAGKLSPKDRANLAGKWNKATRDKIEDLARRWTNLSEEIKVATNVQSTRFGKGKKLYSPSPKNSPTYNPKLFKKHTGVKTSELFSQGTIDSYMRSNVDEVFGLSRSKKLKALTSTKEDIIKQYDAGLQPLEDKVSALAAKQQGAIYKAGKIFTFPTKIWKKSVLTLRPAWYVNNEGFNVASAFTSGGPGAMLKRIGASKKLSKLDLDPKQLKEVLGYSDTFYGGGKLGKLGSRQEGNARAGLYLQMRGTKLDHDGAMKVVNEALNDYGPLANWEKPFRAVMPFWSWQKFITKRIVTMPITNPRGASVWANIYNEAYVKPLSQLPDEDIQYVDADTGEVTTYNPRKTKEGKLYNPFSKQWMNTPFNAFTPDAMMNLGIHPAITAWN